MPGAITSSHTELSAAQGLPAQPSISSQHSLTVQLEASPGVGADGKENKHSSHGAAAASKTPKTPKAALRKRLLEARTALGGVKLGEAPKRSISFHPDFLHGVCDDDLA